MLFLKDMTPLKIYRKQFFLPTKENDNINPNKKTGAAIFLLTPNYQSSLALMNYPLLINRLRYQSYFFQHDVVYYLNDRKLKSEEEEMEESYVRDIADLNYLTEDDDPDEISDYIHISGDKSSVDFFNQSIKPRLSYKISYLLDDLTKDGDFNCPIFNIELSSVFDVNEDFYFYMKSGDHNRSIINIKLPAYRETESIDSYSNRIINYIIKCIVIAKDNELSDTNIPLILADYISDADSKYADYGKFIYSDRDYKDAFYDNLKNHNYKNIMYLINKMFSDVNMLDILPNKDDLFTEGKTPITLENLGRKFKYASTTKFKKQTTQKINHIKRQMRDTVFATPLQIPYVGSPNAQQSESTIMDDEDLFKISDNCGILFEFSTNDAQLKRFLYRDRIRNRKIILQSIKQIKKDNPNIRYAYTSLDLYKGKNVFIDLYFYNEVYFRNVAAANVNSNRNLNIYNDLIDRLINDPRITTNGYSKKTIFIPVKDWHINPNTRMWMYSESVNPVSIILRLMTSNPSQLKRTFKDYDIVFFDDRDQVFRINFSLWSEKQIKLSAIKFRSFIMKFCANDTFEPEDIEEPTSDSPEAIKADIYDKIERSKGIDLTGKEKPVNNQLKMSNSRTEVVNKPAPTRREEKVTPPRVTPNSTMGRNQFSSGDLPINNNKVAAVITKAAKEEVKKEEDSAKLSKKADKDKEVEKQEKMQRLARVVDNASKNSDSTDEALDKMEPKKSDIIKMMNDIQSLSSGKPDISATRGARINTLTQDLQWKEINGKTVKELLDENPSTTPIEHTELNVASPNVEWKDLTYMNFDKNYDLDRDIVACFSHFATVSHPLAIRDIKATDNSTSEDRLELYTVNFEDYRGKRFTVKLDIPVMIDNRFLLRGNDKVIATQFLNMPILKTDLGAAQIITNYQKIFIYRFRNNSGCSNPIAGRIIRALKKYKGTNLVIQPGDNSRVSNKYQLPIDYIDIGSTYNSIENKKTGIKFYLNQDEVLEDFKDQISESKGVPIAYDTNKKELLYMSSMDTQFSQILLNDLYTDEEFRKLFNSAKPTIKGTFSQCSILDERMPLVLVASFRSGLNALMKRAGVKFEWKETLTREDRTDFNKDFIIFKNGYLVYNSDSYASCLLMNGLKELPTADYNMADMEKKDTYIEFLDDYGGRIKADGIENFYDCLVDPITKEVLQHYKLPTEFVDILLYANVLMADNKYIKHTDTSSRRIRREEMVAAYTYEALTEAYARYANAIRHGSGNATFSLKQSIVIDKLLQSPISQDDSVNNALGAVEETNNITFKGKSGLNSDRAYSLDKRTYDDSMVNVLGQSTNFSASVGINRASTIDMNIEGTRGYIVQNHGNTDNMNTAKSLTATEALIPFEATSDDSGRIGMSFLQTSKHQIRTEKMDPPLVTNGFDQVLPYITTNTFCKKSQEDGVVKELTDDYMIVEYKSGKKDYIDLKNEIKKNSDGGYYVPLKLSVPNNVTVGTKFSKEQILAYDKDSFSAKTVGESDNVAYNVGTLAKVGIFSSDDCYEDSGVVTRSLADKLTTQVIYKFEHVIEKDSLIIQHKKVGDIINVGDPLIIWQDAFEEGEDVNAIMKAIAKTGLDASELGRRVVKSETTGVVAGIKVFRTCELKDMSESVREFVDEYESPIKSLKKKLESEGIDTKSLPATYKLPTTGKLKKAEDAIYVEYYIQHRDKVGIGDKGTFLSANKFTCKYIIPEERTPYTDFRPDEPVDAFLSVSSINKRMVTSILKNGALNKLMIELDRTIKDELDIPYDVKNI